MSESESVRLVQAASLEIRASVIETMRQAEALDHRYSTDYVSRTVRQVLAAWAMAVDGDGSGLAAITEPDVAHGLLHPTRATPWQVAPGPRVTQIEVWSIEPDREPPELHVQFRFTGHRRFDDPGRAEEAGADPHFVGSLGLKLPGSGPWRLADSLIETSMSTSTTYSSAAARRPRSTGSAPGHQPVPWRRPGRCAGTGSSPASPSMTNGSVPGRRSRYS